MRRNDPSRSRARSLSDQLLDQLEASGLSPYAVARSAGLDPCILGRWVGGRRGITLDTADRVAEALGGFRLIGLDRGNKARSRKDAPRRAGAGPSGGADIVEGPGPAGGVDHRVPADDRPTPSYDAGPAVAGESGDDVAGID